MKDFMPKVKLHFSGSSPPEIFIGRYNYPNVFAGVLSPQETGSTEVYGMPELWFKRKAEIQDILGYRGKLIYGRFKSNVKNKDNKFLGVMQEVSMANKSVSTEFFLKKAPKLNLEVDKHYPVIGNPGAIESIRLEENPHIAKKVEYLVSDDDVKSCNAINELHSSKIEISNIIKILSAGLLGLRMQRKLVPTRWAVTAVDDSISKALLERIRFFSEIQEFQLFHSEYLGNHYEFLLLPGKFSFEVLEAKMTGSVWNPSGSLSISQDYEGFYGRKEYADNVTGAYYANRLALCEYFSRIQRQGACLVLRECKPEYYAPLGVGILREASRDAFEKKPEVFSGINEALEQAGKRMKLPVNLFKEKSWLLKEYGRQKTLSSFIG
jgi:hypothetical protein